MTPQTKTITSSDGTEYTYTCTPHPAEEGVDLLPVLLTIGAPLLGAIVGGGAGPKSKSDAEAMLDALESGGGEGLDAELDGAALAGAVRAFALEFARAGGSKLCKKMLAHTIRDGPGADGSNKAIKVGDKAGFSAAYQGNYAELIQAIAFAIQVNFLPSLRANSGSGLMSRMTQLLSTLND